MPHTSSFACFLHNSWRAPRRAASTIRSSPRPAGPAGRRGGDTLRSAPLLQPGQPRPLCPALRAGRCRRSLGPSSAAPQARSGREGGVSRGSPPGRAGTGTRPRGLRPVAAEPGAQARSSLQRPPRVGPFLPLPRALSSPRASSPPTPHFKVTPRTRAPLIFTFFSFFPPRQRAAELAQEGVIFLSGRGRFRGGGLRGRRGLLGGSCHDGRAGAGG